MFIGLLFKIYGDEDIEFEKAAWGGDAVAEGARGDFGFWIIGVALAFGTGNCAER